MAFLALVDQQSFGVVTTGTVNGRRENEPTALGSGEPLHHPKRNAIYTGAAP